MAIRKDNVLLERLVKHEALVYGQENEEDKEQEPGIEAALCACNCSM